MRWTSFEQAIAALRRFSARSTSAHGMQRAPEEPVAPMLRVLCCRVMLASSGVRGRRVWALVPARAKDVSERGGGAGGGERG